MHQSIQNGVRKRWVTEVLMPVFNGKLAGDERRAAADAVVEEFEQVTAFARADGRDGEVIDHHEIDLGDGGEAFAEAAVGVTEAEFVE